MTERRLQIPTGMQDTLPGECAVKRRLEQELRETFRRSGYQEIETPILEYYDALDDATYGYRPEHVWKTFDAQGRVLVIRPDTTVPAVRIASGRLAEAALPLRLCYMQSAARYQSDTLSMLCEETQAGAELMGESSPEADAELIALAIETLESAGLKDFQIELGQAAFFDGFMQEAGLTAEQSAVMRELTEQKNQLGMQLYLSKLNVSGEVAARLMRLPQLYGDASVLDEAEKLTNHPICRAALDNLRQVMDAVKVYGLDGYLTIDLGMVHRANYYSGVLFRGMTASLGQPLLSGGRYDGLPGRFGRGMPATGFALSLKLLLIALERQGQSFDMPVPDVMIGFEQGMLAEAIALAREERAKGVSVAMQYDASPDELQAKAEAGQTREAVWIGQNGAKRFEAPKEDA